MLSQLKTVVLIKEAIKLAFFRLVSGASAFVGSITGSKWPETKKGYSMREIAKKLKISYNAVYYYLHRTAQTVSNQNRKSSGRPQCTTEQEDKYISLSSWRNRRLTSPQLAASLNSTCKTLVSMSTVKRRLRDAGLLPDVCILSLCVCV